MENRDEHDEGRFRRALSTLLEAEREASAMTQEVQSALDLHMSKGSKAEGSATDEAHARFDKKGKQRQVSEPLTDLESSDDEDHLGSPAGEEHGKKRGALQNRLRECRIALHRTKFLQGDMYHALGQTESEDAAYDAAEKIRRDLLKG